MITSDDILICIPPKNVRDVWHVVRPMINRAYAAVDEDRPPEMLEALTAGKLLLWVYAVGGDIVAALVTALVPKPSGLACKLMVCGGGAMEDWLVRGHRQIEAYARAEGCDRLTMEGRRGWARLLPGYDVKRVVLEKRLS
jgi:hypothetical protein